MVLVNDGSTDRSAEVLNRLSAEIPELVCVLLRKNYGQTAAMAAGFDMSNGKIIASGSPNEIIKDSSAKSAYFGDEFKIN